MGTTTATTRPGSELELASRDRSARDTSFKDASFKNTCLKNTSFKPYKIQKKTSGGLSKQFGHIHSSTGSMSMATLRRTGGQNSSSSSSHNKMWRVQPFGKIPKRMNLFSKH